jgi:hypothetical protein
MGCSSSTSADYEAKVQGHMVEPEVGRPVMVTLPSELHPTAIFPLGMVSPIVSSHKIEKTHLLGKSRCA